MKLTKGQNAPLSGSSITVTASSAQSLDLIAVVADESGKVRSDRDLVFYNAPKHFSGVATVTSQGLVFDLSAAEHDVSKLHIIVTSDEKPVPAFELQFGGTGSTERYSFSDRPSNAETAVIGVELYRRGDAWKVRAVGQGYADGLAGLVRDFGVTVDEAPGAAVSIGASEPSPLPVANTVVATSTRPAPVSSAHRAATASSKAPAVPPVERTPRKVVVEHGQPFLEERAKRWADDTVSAVRTRDLSSSLENTVTKMAATFPRTEVQSSVDALRATHNTDRSRLAKSMNDLRGAIRTKYGSKLPNDWSTIPPANSYEAAIPHHTWVRSADALTTKIRASGTPLLKSQRLQQFDDLVGATNKLMLSYTGSLDSLQSEFDRTVAEVYRTAFTSFSSSAKSAATQSIAHWQKTLPVRLPKPHSTLGPVWLSKVAASDIRTGVAELKFPVGHVGCSGFDYGLTYSPGHPVETSLVAQGTVSLKPEEHSIPLILDLDKSGGFVTDSAVVLENVAIEMLALLPAGRVKIDGVDPVKLGASMNFLYGLGDAGPRIYGDKVWGSHNVAELLVELEAHVAFVTQKYLQGSHETLTSYNREAGEVAEPYRLVLLFDHPKAFSKDGRTKDEEALTRLKRLADVGRRAGVIILAQAPNKPSELAALGSAMTSTEDTTTTASLRLPTSLPKDNPVAATATHWTLSPYASPTAAQKSDLLAHIERQLAAAADVRVDPAKVFVLAQSEAQRAAAKGIRASETIADPDSPATWWTGESSNKVVTRFGRMGAANVASLQLNSGDYPAALVGGRTGSGKSVLLHSLILGWAMQYPPEELEFYLIDFKEGVEFKPYAAGNLPHARVVAIETNREFGISVLQSLDNEIEARGRAFKKVGGGEVNLDTYRRNTGILLPRIVLVIDEFHMMLEGDDEASRVAAALIERVVRQGRAFGVHALLASQSVSGSAQKIRVALDQIRSRLVLASSAKDSELLLADNNVDAHLLSKPGEGIINTKAGLRDANNRFQCAYWSGEARERAVQTMRDLANSRGYTRRPVVFEGNAEAHVEEFDHQLFQASSRIGALELPVGAPMSLSQPVSMTIARAAGGNLLIVNPEGEETLALLAASLLASGIAVDIVDFAALSEKWVDTFKAFTDHGAKLTRGRQMPSLLKELSDLIDERIALDDFHATSRVLMLAGVQRARDLTPDSPYGNDEPTPSELLTKLIKDGPEVGIHVIAWTDRYASFLRRFDISAGREFSHKLLGPMSESDSRQLADTSDAAELANSQYLYDDFDTGDQIRARRFAVQDPQWLIALASRAGASESV